MLSVLEPESQAAAIDPPASFDLLLRPSLGDSFFSNFGRIITWNGPGMDILMHRGCRHLDDSTIAVWLGQWSCETIMLASLDLLRTSKFPACLTGWDLSGIEMALASIIVLCLFGVRKEGLGGVHAFKAV